jgi:hypothetical protein
MESWSDGPQSSGFLGRGSDEVTRCPRFNCKGKSEAGFSGDIAGAKGRGANATALVGRARFSSARFGRGGQDVQVA